MVIPFWRTNRDNAYRFYDIAWGQPNDEHPRGIIAGAMENGSLDLWDAEKLINGEDALISRTTKHTGPIKALQFNPLRPQVLATAGAKGELFVWDVNDTSAPFRLGTAAAHDIDCLAWNPKVANILATGGAGGFVTVWDLKTKKASLTLNNHRKAVSAIAWDPENSTKLLTGTSDDTAPVILLWNLRNSQAPEKTLQGHDQGVLSLSWCQQDSGLLLSCGKDNRTLIWNPQTGERYGEFPEATNWTFYTRFNPHNPNLSATASFDGKIAIQTLQNTNPSSAPAAQNNLSDDDFFSKAASQPQAASFSLPRAPAWAERPVGVSFGFGGKLVFFNKAETASGQKRSSKLQISSFSIDSDIGSATEKFEQAIQSGDIASICEEHIENAKTDEEKAEWQVMQTLSESDGRTKIIERLGFTKDEPVEETKEAESPKSPEPKEEDSSSLKPNGGGGKKHRRVVSMWGDADDGEDFLSEIAATKGAKTDNPFNLLSVGNTHLEDQITRALILGKFEKAVEICLKEQRWSDAFLIANCGSKELVEKVQTAYLQDKRGSPSYLRLISSVVAKNLWDIAYNADLADWKETLVTLCTYAEPAEFPDLCEALGDRIFESGNRKDASFCYLIGSKLEKVVGIWVDELEETEQAALKEETGDSTFSVHAKSLQHFIEKVSIFRHVTKFNDSEKNLTEGWKLAALYDKYLEYADIAAAHGQLSVAQKYLDLLPTNYPPAETARNRVKLATQKAGTQPAARQATPAARTTTSRTAAPVGYQPPSLVPAPVNPSPLNPYAPPAPAPVNAAAGNPYAAPIAPAPVTTSQYGAPSSQYGAPQNQGYAPSGYTPPAQSYAPTPVTGYGVPAQNFGQPSPLGGPPKSTGPPVQLKRDGVWNDVPMVTKAPPRRNTPSVAPITSPFGGQPGVASPPPTGQFQRGAPTPPPPPPKGSAPPRNVGAPPTGPPRPSSVSSNATNPYAPPPPAANLQPAYGAPPAPRTASPYNPPPSAAAPPTSRYAPAPAAQQYTQGPPSGSGIAPPPSGAYTPAPPSATQQYAAPPPPRAGFSAPPPASRPPGGGPPPSAGGPPQQQAPPPAAAAPPAAPPKARYPPGDRSNIPEHAKELVEILSRDMQRVASKAPASFAPQVKDTQKRLNILFDHLNNEELIKSDTIDQLAQLAGALAEKNYDIASKIQVEISKEKTDECGSWMVSFSLPYACSKLVKVQVLTVNVLQVGVKRLISMSKATP